MIRKRVPKLLTVLATAACIFGLVLVAPAATPTLSPMPEASAVPLPNQYDVSCVPNGANVVCTITGCPRVYEDYAGDVVHIKINGGPQEEIAKACGDPLVYTVKVPETEGFNLAMQGCRKYDLSSDECGPFSDFKYSPPASVLPVKCNPPENFTSAEVPAGQECQPKPKVKCPEGSPTVDAVSLDKCAAAPPKECPPGSAAPEVPFGQECAGPANAVSMNVTQEGLNANVAITNNSPLPAECTYTATKTGGLLGPASVNRNVSVGPNSTGNITDMLWPPLGTSYRASTKCTANYDGKQVSIGESTQNIG
jgi:hypothetical protein